MNTDMIEVVALLDLESFRYEADTVSGTWCLRAFRNPAVTRRLTSGILHSRDPIEPSTAKEAISKPPDSRNSSQSPQPPSETENVNLGRFGPSQRFQPRRRQFEQFGTGESSLLLPVLFHFYKPPDFITLYILVLKPGAPVGATSHCNVPLDSLRKETHKLHHRPPVPTIRHFLAVQNHACYSPLRRLL